MNLCIPKKEVYMEARKKKEKQFHDVLRKGAFAQRWSHELEKLIGENPLWLNMKYYSVERKSRNLVLDWFSDNCNGKRVLDYCCGNGDDSFIIARKGAAEVIGIDLSQVSIDNCSQVAISEGLGGRTSFYVMDAEDLKFEDNYFDIITEYGVLHHLDIKKAYPELARVLKPEGKCICVETLGHNPFIRLYRKKTPDLRTKWEVEHILRKNDIEKAGEYFGRINILGFFHLATLAAVPFRNSPIFEFLLGMLETVDSVILKVPFLKWQAWQVVFTLSEPKNIS
jgi:ubiquinone/menaquinone biosynthesis C-methylase UbiE